MKTLVFHSTITFSRTEEVSRSLSGSGTRTGRLFASLFILSSSAQLRQHEGHVSVIKMALVHRSKVVSQDARDLQPKSCKTGRSSRDFRYRKRGTKVDKPFGDLGGIHLTDGRHLYDRRSHVSRLSRLPL